MSYETLLIDVDGGIAVCTFNRPAVRNALNEQMVDELRAMLAELGGRDDVAALIFTGGEGKAFVSGADIAELRERRRADAFRRINNTILRELELCPVPTIAAINGWALGGGCELALACDIRIAAERAKLGQPEVTLGIMPGAGATYRLPKAVGIGWAKELIYTGRIVDAAEALRIGLVNHVVPDGELLEKARAIATEIAANSHLAVRFAKLALNGAAEMSTDVAMAFEANAQAVLFEDEEKLRRMDEFLKKRSNKERSRKEKRS